MTITVENSIRDLLPEVVIDFLWEIINKDNTIQTIWLVPVKLSSNNIQEIFIKNKNGITKRRVFGFIPVDAKLTVSHEGGGLLIQLAV
jgi:hypothetical protein